MIVEQTLDISDPIVTYCFKLAEQCLNRISSNQQKFFIYHPSNNPWLSENHHELLLDKNINVFIRLAKQILLNNGFIVDETNQDINVELHFGYASEEDSEEIFKIHRDDNLQIVNTLIVYFDVSCTGGELVFYNNNQKADIIRTINVKNPSKNTCKIIMFNGDLLHKPLPFRCGKRHLIVYQIPTIR